jgi:hypothetical protein
MDRHTYSGLINNLEENQIFVFGSNPEGRHGAGSAKIARIKYGAKYWNGRGLQGTSYALVTKNLKKDYFEKATGITYKRYGARSVTKEQIVNNIKDMYKVAEEMEDSEFIVIYKADTVNLNGYSSQELAHMFKEAEPIPPNIVFEDKFLNLVFNK